MAAFVAAQRAQQPLTTFTQALRNEGGQIQYFGLGEGNVREAKVPSRGNFTKVPYTAVRTRGRVTIPSPQAKAHAKAVYEAKARAAGKQPGVYSEKVANLLRGSAAYGPYRQAGELKIREEVRAAPNEKLTASERKIGNLYASEAYIRDHPNGKVDAKGRSLQQLAFERKVKRVRDPLSSSLKKDIKTLKSIYAGLGSDSYRISANGPTISGDVLSRYYDDVVKIGPEKFSVLGDKRAVSAGGGGVLGRKRGKLTDAQLAQRRASRNANDLARLRAQGLVQ